MNKITLFPVTMLATLFVVGVLLYIINLEGPVSENNGSTGDGDNVEIDQVGSIASDVKGSDIGENSFVIRSRPNSINEDYADGFLSDYLENSDFIDNEIIAKSTSALEIIDALSAQHNWSDEEKYGNMRIWYEACAGTEQYVDHHLDSAELMAFDARAGYLKLLSEYCKDVSLYYEIEVLGKFLANSDSPNENLSADYGFTSTLESFGDEQALEYAANSISEALQRQEEDTIYRLLFLISANDLLEPIFYNNNPNYDFLYENVTAEVSAALICRTLDGCAGSNHPMILRQCVRRNQSHGVGCVDPGNLNDAIYQTLTPPEYQAFVLFYDQVIHLIQTRQ